MAIAQKYIGKGRSAIFHPKEPLFIYSAARTTGKLITSHDLKIMNFSGEGKWLTDTRTQSELSASFSPDGKELFFSAQNSTDLFRLKLL